MHSAHQAAAQLEGSKAWSKAIMEAGIPTAASGTFEDADDAKEWVQALPPSGRESRWSSRW